MGWKMNDRQTISRGIEKEYIIFKVGDIRCGIAIDHVREINRNSDITKVYTAPPYVRGVINLRGQIVTVLDLAHKLEVRTSRNQIDIKNLIVESENELVGFLVDEVDDIVRADSKNIYPPPSQREGPFERYLSEVLETQDGLVRILDVDRLIQK